MAICSRIWEKRKNGSWRNSFGCTYAVIAARVWVSRCAGAITFTSSTGFCVLSTISSPSSCGDCAGSETEPQAAAPLRVLVGKSLLINTTERLKRISVTDPAIADALVVTPTQILVHGRAAGEVSLLIWDELERSRSFDLRVDVDVTAAAEEERQVFPEEQITVTPSRSALVLSGHVSTEDVAKRAELIAGAYSKSVVNVLTFGPVGAQEVLLEVKLPRKSIAAR